jgi:hypothetical protein
VQVRGKQALRIGVRAFPEHVARRPSFDKAAGIHYRKPVADLDCGANIVGDEYDSHAQLALQFAQEQ